MANLTNIRPEADPFADRRSFPRVSVALPAFLMVDGRRHSVQIIDLSSGGAKLSCAVEFAIGAAALLDCGTLGCAAVVQWQRGGQLGLSFANGLDAREVSALIDRSNALSALMKKRG